MATSSRTKQSGPVLHTSSAFQRSISPSGRFCSSSSSAFASSISTFSSPSSSLLGRPSSPTRVNLCGTGQSSRSVRFAIDRPVSPNRSFAVSHQVVKKPSNNGFSGKKKTCMCSPTTHPGSFRCSLHKNLSGNHTPRGQSQMASYHSNGLDARRSAMKNSLVRIGTVEGEWVKRALATLIRPSSHQQRRRAAFQPRPSRLSITSKAEDP
ncbi:uncharacterized protein LOC131158128 [Malania oleifera]|uniref:uncharacterized protein LOC131158128 n=1 Tax=Malania oleifera TaxID=397392 RepID=UPI0025AE7144|nr:uncharacterized protein LOC131158128 [Malania oleifera]